MTTPVLERFYQRLIKTPMNLDTRNRLGSLLAAEVRHEQSEQWQSIVSRSDSLLDSLRRLQNDGCLTLKIPYAQALAQELRALPHRGQGQRGPGGRTETEYLEHVNALTSVQKLIQDESLHALVSLYLGAPAYLHSCQAWWQYPMGSEHKASNAQQWHRDRDDLAELKIFSMPRMWMPARAPMASCQAVTQPKGCAEYFHPQAILTLLSMALSTVLSMTTS